MAERSISSEGSQLIKSREDNSDNNDDSDIEQLPISETNDDKSQVQFGDKIGSSGFRKDSNINGNNFTHDSKDIQKSPLSESSSDGLLSDCLSTGPRSRLTSTEDTDSTIKPGKPVDSDSSDGKSIETLDYASSEDKSFEAIDSEEDKQALDYPNRPESLFLQRPMHYEKRRSRSDEHKKIDTARTISSSTAVDIPVRNDPEFMNLEETMLSKSMPYGTVIRKGEMIEFVADDLQEMIKRSSPLTQTASSTTSSRRSSLRSYSSVSSSTSSAVGVSRSPSSLFQQSPDDIPPIDPQAINDLEMHALHVADNLDLLMGNLRNNLHKMSAITVGCLSAYKTSVDTTCDSVDSSIKSMYALMAKCEELSNSMKPVNKLAEQIKEIKRLLDRFEAQIADKQ